MNFEDEMRRFEAEVQRGGQQNLDSFIQGHIHARAGLPLPSHPQHPPPFHPHPQPTITFRPTRPLNPIPTGPTVISAPPQTSGGGNKANEGEEEEEEEDIFAKLAKYEADHKKEGGEKKKKKKKKDKVDVKTTPAVTSSLTTPLSVSSPAQPPAVTSRGTTVPPESSIPLQSSAKSLQQPPPTTTTSTSMTRFPAPPSAVISDESLKKAKMKKRVIRTGGGQIWEDNSLKEWDPSDFRLFCGDLGNDVTDEVLARTFGRYPSFQKAKVIRDKKSNKTKGFGFVSFKDPMDFTRAMKEINGKYVGSRPIKLRKSNWKDRNIDVVRQKQKLKQQMGYKW